jgi:hypothetical protein
LNFACNGHTPHAHPAVLLRAPVLLWGAYRDTGTAPRYRVPPATPCWRRRGVGFEPTPGAGKPTAVPARPSGTPPGNTGGIQYRRGTAGHRWVIPAVHHWRYRGVGFKPTPGASPVPAYQLPVPARHRRVNCYTGTATANQLPCRRAPAAPRGTPPGNTGGIRYRWGTTGHHWVIPVVLATPLGTHWYHGNTSPNPGCPVPASGTHVKTVENWY